MEETSLDNEKCNGCRHQDNGKEGWCYMFNKEPDIFPCAQHDKFKLQRDINGKLIKQFPHLVSMMEYGLFSKDLDHDIVDAVNDNFFDLLPKDGE